MKRHFLVVLVVLATFPLTIEAQQETPVEPKSTEISNAQNGSAPEAEPPMAEELIREGMALFDEDDYERALVKFEGAVAAEPENPAAHLVRHVTRRWLGDKQGATADRERALALAEQARAANPEYDVPKVVKAWVARVEGQAEMRALNFHGALTLLQTATELNPEDTLAHLHHSHVLMHQQTNDEGWPGFSLTTEAQAALQKATALVSSRLGTEPDSPHWKWLAARRLLLEAEHASDRNQALRLLGEVTQHVPNHPEAALRQGGWQLMRKGDKKQGLADLKRGRDLAQVEMARGGKVMFHNYMLALASNMEGWHRLGDKWDRWYKKDKADAGLPYFEEAARLSPLDAGFLLPVCRAFRDRFYWEKNPEQASRYLGGAWECAHELSVVAPNSYQASVWPASLTQMEGSKLSNAKRKDEAAAKFSDAIDKYDEAIRSHPREPRLRLAKAYVQVYLSDNQRDPTAKASFVEQAKRSAAEAVYLSGNQNYADGLFQWLAYKNMGWGGMLAMAMAGMAGGMATGNVAGANLAMMAEIQRQQAQLEADAAAMKASAGISTDSQRQKSVLEDLSAVFLQIAQGIPQMQAQAQAEVDAVRQMYEPAILAAQKREAEELEAKKKALEEEQKKKDAAEELRRQQEASRPQPTSSPQQSQPQLQPKPQPQPPSPQPKPQPQQPSFSEQKRRANQQAVDEFKANAATIQIGVWGSSECQRPRANISVGLKVLGAEAPMKDGLTQYLSGAWFGQGMPYLDRNQDISVPGDDWTVGNWGVSLGCGMKTYYITYDRRKYPDGPMLRFDWTLSYEDERCIAKTCTESGWKSRTVWGGQTYTFKGE